MTELSKEMRIVYLVNIAVAFIYGILFLFIPEITRGLRDSTDYDIQFWMLWGATCLSLAIAGIINFMRKTWENIKVILELAIILLVLMIIVNIISLFLITRSVTAITMQWVDNIVIIILIAVDIFFYLREEK